MPRWTRREVLKGGLATSVAAWAGRPAWARAQPAAAAVPAGRERLLLDFGWRFHLGHADDPERDFGFGREAEFAKVGRLFAPSKPDFDDGGWRAVALPHDWAVELPFENARALVAGGSKPLGRAYPATSIGWYRRAFEIPETDRGRRLSLEFDGVFRDATVALNGHFLGRNLSGYAPFRHDVTDVAVYGGRNVLVVRVDATEKEGWFYEGAGIYRHVWLVKTSPLHVGHWGTFVASSLRGSAAALTITTELENESDTERPFRLVSTILDPAGKVVATDAATPAALGPWDRRTVEQPLPVPVPVLWSVDAPSLYRLVTTVESGGTETDKYETPFGIRSIRFDADRGFFLNGKHLELKGTCNHQDHAGVGAALPDRLHGYRIERLKAMGSNAYRTAHNPPAPEVLDACDRLGMLVLDETRLFSAQEEGLGQLERMVRRDRNHPSVFGWSIANEEWAVQGNERGARIAAGMVRLARRLDPTRPITAAMDGAWGEGMATVVDVIGCNYEELSRPDRNLDVLRRRFPRLPAMGTEVGSTFSTRGIYATDKERGYVSAYDVNRPPYGATAEQWKTAFAARPHLAGGFVWTGFDYRGEPAPYEWPCISSHFGIMDTCGFAKDNFHYYRAWWGDASVLHLLPHWNWPGREGQEIEVWCHTNLDRVELLLNGTSLGTQDVVRNSHVSWKVPYAPGLLEAKGYKADRLVFTTRRETTGAPARIVLRPDRTSLSADGEDASIVEVQVVDAEGRLVPVADAEIAFRVTGSGQLIGVGNGDPSSHEADKGATRRVFGGLAQAIVQASRQPGEIQVEATSAGLEAGSVTIACESATPRPSVP